VLLLLEPVVVKLFVSVVLLPNKYSPLKDKKMCDFCRDPGTQTGKAKIELLYQSINKGHMSGYCQLADKYLQLNTYWERRDVLRISSMQLSYISRKRAAWLCQIVLQPWLFLPARDHC
jgi:hypothetical protein